MSDTFEAQGTVIAVGLLAAVAVMLFGVVVSPTIAGVDTMVAMMWIFAATFGAMSVLHAVVGQYNFAWGHGGAAFGWVLILLESSSFSVTLGLGLLVLSGGYIFLLSRRSERQVVDADSEADQLDS